MLTWLRIRDLVLHEDLQVEPGASLTVITGETGAGKSMLVDALELVVGGRADTGLVRTGAEEAVVEAQFDVSADSGLRDRLAELGSADDELVVRRTVREGGRSRATVNGQLVTAQQLTRLLAATVDICSQHEHHDLADPGSHLGYLDAWGGLDTARARVEAAHERWSVASRALDDGLARLRQRAEREAVLRFLVEEIDVVDPKADELDGLEAEHGRLAHVARLADAARTAQEVLEGDDGVAPRLDQLHPVAHAVAGIDPSLDALFEQLAACHDTLNDLARELGRFTRRATADPQRLREVEERLAALRRLLRKHGSLDRILALRDDARAELEALERLDDELGALETARDAAASDAAVAARHLSAQRRAGAATLGEAITAELRDLGMGDARMEVDVAPLEPRGDGLVVDGARIGATGMDRAELMIAPNLGETPRPLRRIGSGGELSRALLAIKRVLASRAPRGLLVFDEVDTGVGGGVAEAIGRKLAQVARHHQVICITHLPQIAVYGQTHLHVRKRTEGGRTRSQVTVLAGAERREEIARMMGGLTLTDATREAAQALLDQAAAAVAAADPTS